MHLKSSLIQMFVTHADKSHETKAFICVCLSVYPHGRTKMAEITKLATGIVHHESWLPI